VAVLYRLDHSLMRKLETLKKLNMGRCFANIVSSESFTQHEMPTLPVTHHHMEEALSGVQTSRNSVVAPREVLTVTPRYATLMVFYTDASLIDGCAGFAIHRT
jgi:hypothetical protein